MNRFLHQQGLTRSQVRLPFIVLVHTDPATKGVQRSVLHGAAMQQWLSEMVGTVLATTGWTGTRVKQTFLDPFISPNHDPANDRS